MALKKEERDKILERFNSLSQDEQDAILDVARSKLPKADTVTVADLLKTIEALQADIAGLKKGRDGKDDKSFFDILLGR